VTLISAPLSSRPTQAGTQTASATAQPDAFASILLGVLTADASGGSPVPGVATADGQNASATTLAEADWPTGQHPEVPDGHHDIPTDATAPVPASLPPTPAVASTAVAAVDQTAGIDGAEAPTAVVPERAAIDQDAAEPVSPARNPGAPASSPMPGDTLHPTRQTPRLPTDAPTTDPTQEPLQDRHVSPPLPTVSETGTQPPTAPAGHSPASRPSTAAPAGIQETSTAAGEGTNPATPTSPVPAPMPMATGPVPSGAGSQPAEAATFVRAPALPASPQSEAGVVPVPAVSPPTPTAPALATAPAAPVPATPPAPAQPLNTQLAQPLFSLAGARQGEHVMTVQVTPENLGPVTVRAVISADDIRIELFSASEGGREALRQILSDLRRDLAGSGLSASLDLSSKDAQDSRHERAPFREIPRGDAPAPVALPEPRPVHSSNVTSTLDITV
jgi:flagellar hook-length control protein FliK